MKQVSKAKFIFNAGLKHKNKCFIESGKFPPDVVSFEIELSEELRERLINSSAFLKNTNITILTIEINRLSNGEIFFYEHDSPEAALMDFLQQEEIIAAKKKAKQESLDTIQSALQWLNRLAYLDGEAEVIGMLSKPDMPGSPFNYDKETWDYITKISEQQKEIAAQAAQVNRDATIASQTQFLLLLKNWGAEHGSEYLQNLIAHNFHFSNVAIVEYAIERGAEVWAALEELDRNDCDFNIAIVDTPTVDVLNDYLRFADLQNVELMEVQTYDEVTAYYAVYDDQPFPDCSETIRLGIKLSPVPSK